MRIDATDPKWPEWVKYLFPCDGDESHYLYVSWWADERDPDWDGFLEVTGTYWSPNLWDRIKGAAKILSGQRHYGDGIVLTEETTDRLIETLEELKSQRGKTNGKVQPASKDEYSNQD